MQTAGRFASTHKRMRDSRCESPSFFAQALTLVLPLPKGIFVCVPHGGGRCHHPRIIATCEDPHLSSEPSLTDGNAVEVACVV